MPAAGVAQQKGPNSFPWCLTTCCTTNASKVEKLGLPSSGLSTILTDLLPTNYHFFMHLNNFFQGKCFLNQKEAENAFQVFVKSQSPDLYTIRINKFTGKHMLIVAVLVLINKDAFEPSYNVLKSTIQNCNHICTNLISCFDLHALRHYRDEAPKF